MLKRLGIGLLKGLVVGGGIGAALQFGLQWVPAAGLLGYLLAMGIGATTGILCGKPVWRTEAWIESLLKGGFGVGVGALLYWVSSSYLGFGIPIALPGVEAGTAWTSLPVFYGAAIGAVYGSLVELDNTDDDSGKSAKKGGAKSARARVSDLEDDYEEIEIPIETSGKKSKKA